MIHFHIPDDQAANVPVISVDGATAETNRDSEDDSPLIRSFGSAPGLYVYPFRQNLHIQIPLMRSEYTSITDNIDTSHVDLSNSSSGSLFQLDPDNTNAGVSPRSSISAAEKALLSAEESEAKVMETLRDNASFCCLLESVNEEVEWQLTIRSSPDCVDELEVIDVSEFEAKTPGSESVCTVSESIVEDETRPLIREKN